MDAYVYSSPLQLRQNPRAPETLAPLGDYLRHWANGYASHTALVDGSERISYSELKRRVDRLAAALHALGLRRGERAMVQLPNGIGFVTLCFALFRLGVVPVLAMPTQRAHDIDALCRIAEPVAYFVPQRLNDFDYLPMATEMVRTHSSIRTVIVDGESGGSTCPALSLATLDAEPIALTAPEPGEIALLLLSGGSTGTPKLIPRTHADYAYNFTASAELCGFGSDTVYLAILPIAHNFALACPGILGALASGGTVVLSPSASPDEAMPLIEQERVTHLALVPPLAQLWTQAREWEESDLSSLRLVQVGGSRLEPALAQRLPQTLGCPLQQVFGMAEGLLCYTRLDDPQDSIINTQGRPLSPQDEIRIVDEQDRDLPDGEIGQLITRGPYTIQGYYRAPEHNAVSFTADGYYRTGDLVRRDRSGNLIVEGRLKEQINRGGEKVSAAEVELILNDLPEVAVAVVVGTPDPLLGERICAFVQWQGASSDPGELRHTLRMRGLSEFKLPDQFETISHWPLTAVGKIDKQRLVTMARERGLNEPKAKAGAVYAEHRLSVSSTPLELSARLARHCSPGDFNLYERGNEWSIGLDSAMDIIVEADGRIHRSDGASWQELPVCEGIARAFADIPFNAWRAYGHATFELAYRIHGVAGPTGDLPLLKLSIPRHEIRLTGGEALIRTLNPAELTALEAWVKALDATDGQLAGEAIEIAQGSQAEQTAYKEQVASAVQEIQSCAYQKVILSRPVELPVPIDMVSSYLAGRQANTPARSFLLRDGDFESYGFSPETVVEVDAQGWVSTQPLAGTRALSGDPLEDAHLERELLADEKEIAEHAVSVKLALEEMAAVCTDDSLCVSEFMAIYRRGSVRHLASRVLGRLDYGRTAWSAFEKLFPAVTASGIPKREALDSIRRHEPQPRGLYSGCVITVDSDGTLDAALVLRSVYRNRNRTWLQAGAGLVPSSLPEREWTETCEKLASVSRHLRIWAKTCGR
jgi:yersiniabactin salicyl-AMP ligase